MSREVIAPMKKQNIILLKKIYISTEVYIMSIKEAKSAGTGEMKF